MKKFIDLVDTSGMSDEEKKQWESVGSAIEKTAKGIVSDEINLDEFKKSLVDELKGMDEFKKADVSAFIEQKKFDDALKEVKDEIIKLKSATETGSSKKEQKVKSLEEQILDQFKGYVSEENGVKVIDFEKACKESKGRTKTIEVEFATKADTVMSGGVATTVYGHVIDPVLSVDPRSLTVMRQVANVAGISGREITYAEFVPGQGDAEWVPEGGLKPAMDATLREKNVKVGKVALTSKLTEETLSDLPQLVAEIQTELIYRIGLTEEEGILRGTGQDGEIKGILDSIPGFVLANYQVKRANKYDAIVAAYTQIVSTSNMAYRPNLILMNPIDYALMQSEKDVNGQYLRPFRVGDELIQGLRVNSTTAIEQGTFFMGDFNYMNIRDRSGMAITFGWENDDFTKNKVTMIGEKRLLAYIKSQYRTAFVYDLFDTVITAIGA